MFSCIEILHWERHRETERDRDRDRDRDRERQRETERQTDRERQRQTDRQIGRQTDRVKSDVLEFPNFCLSDFAVGRIKSKSALRNIEYEGALQIEVPSFFHSLIFWGKKNY